MTCPNCFDAKVGWCSACGVDSSPKPKPDESCPFCDCPKPLLIQPHLVIAWASGTTEYCKSYIDRLVSGVGIESAQEQIAKLQERVEELEAFIVGEAEAGSDTVVGIIREEK